jgi:hypothetical protein
LYNEADSYLMSAGVYALIGYGTYKAARVINYAFEKNSEVQQKENQEVPQQVIL